MGLKRYVKIHNWLGKNEREKWWCFLVHTTKNACPRVTVLIGPVPITAERRGPVSSRSTQLTHAAHSRTEWVTGLPGQPSWSLGGEIPQITRIFPGPLRVVNATHFFTFPTPIPTHSCGQQKKDASFGTMAEVLSLQWTEVTCLQAKIMLRIQRMRKRLNLLGGPRS